jgi:23S rRNA (uracil1939-C5)-methyltransferase
MNEQTVIKKRQQIELEIESLAFGGQGVARVNDFVIFVNGAIPGQTVKALITKKKKNYAEARVQQIVHDSPLAVVPRCKHFGSCGGCRLQNLDYAEQVKAKGEQVYDILKRIGGLDNFDMLPPIGTEDPFYYRNKMEFSFSRDRWLSQDEIDSGDTFEKQTHYLGFHAKGFFDKVIDLEECHIVAPIATEILKVVRDIAINSDLPVYSTRDHQGFWRFLIVRPTAVTGDLMVNVVTSEHNIEIAEQLKTQLVSAFPQITSLINGVTKSKASVAFCEDEFLLAGQSTITEKLGDYSFTISANSFFQTNSLQAKRLYDIALEYAEFKGDELVYDLYCGAGTISIYISSYVDRVIGVESVESAVINARENCQLNGIENCEFVLGDLKDELHHTNEIIKKYGQPDVIILDPPRGGMHPKTVQAALALKPQKIVHVSCNPTTLARELAEFCESDYKLTKVQPVDMFPHTAHVEVVAQLLRK